MSNKIRVLVVDDSAVMRRLLSDAILGDPSLELAGTAGNGRNALDLIDRLQPDIVTLDIEMPYMNGLETLKEIRTRNSRLPVIMCSSLTAKGATATIECLSLGASDYVTKPERATSPEDAILGFRQSLVPKIVSLCTNGHALFRTRERKPEVAVGPVANAIHPIGLASSLDVVAIGCSTGGPAALAEILPSIPAEFPLPILIVQHMPPMFTNALAERLTGLCRVPVNEAVAGAEITPGQVWIARGDYHMTVVRDNGRMYVDTPRTELENSCRPSVDVLFKSVAQVYGGHVLAVVLTGMGQDGLRGCTRLAEAGAQIIVQDEATSVVWGMPGFVAKAGLAKAVLPSSEIASEVIRRVNASRMAFV